MLNHAWSFNSNSYSSSVGSHLKATWREVEVAVCMIRSQLYTPHNGISISTAQWDQVKVWDKILLKERTARIAQGNVHQGKVNKYFCNLKINFKSNLQDFSPLGCPVKRSNYVVYWTHNSHERKRLFGSNMIWYWKNWFIWELIFNAMMWCASKPDTYLVI